MDLLHEKLEKLKEYLKSLGSVAVAYSSGVDSTFLLKVAKDTLGDKAIAVTAKASAFPARETKEALAFCESEGIKQVIVEFDEMSVEGFKENPGNRCYICKKAIFSKIKAAAAQNGIAYVAEGSNMDDLGDYRPGLQAIAELGVKSPLRYAELTKAEIRELSKELNLPTWNKQSYACLASRFVYGETITKEKLAMVEKAEEKLRELGFGQLRVRIHGNLARIEIEQAEFQKILEKNIASEIDEYFRSVGFMYVSLDLGGYKMGSMNRELV